MSRLAVKAAATTRCWRQGSGRGRALYGGYTGLKGDTRSLDYGSKESEREREREREREGFRVSAFCACGVTCGSVSRHLGVVFAVKSRKPQGLLKSAPVLQISLNRGDSDMHP